MSKVGNIKVGNERVGGSETTDRGLNSTTFSELGNSNVNLAWLFEFDFDSGKRLFNSTSFDIGTAGKAVGEFAIGEQQLGPGKNFFRGSEGEIIDLGTIEESNEISSGKFSITLDAIKDNGLRDVALNENWQNRKAKVWLAAVNDSGEVQGDKIRMYAGRINNFGVSKGLGLNETTIDCSISGGLDGLRRSNSRMYIDEDQREEYPDDKGFEYAGLTKDQMINMKGADFSYAKRRKEDIVEEGMGSILYPVEPDPGLGTSLDTWLSGETSPRNRVFGKRIRVENDLVFADIDSDQLHLVMPVNHGVISDVVEVGLNDKKLLKEDGTTAASVTVNIHKGEPNQSADSDLVSNSSLWTDSHRLRGVAYIYVAIDNSQGVIDQGDSNLWAIVEPKQVENPQNGNVSVTDNAGIVLWHWFKDDFIGLGRDEDLLSLDPAFDRLINRSSDLVTTAEGTKEKRHTINADIKTTEDKKTVLENLRKQFAGSVSFAGGKVRALPHERDSDPVRTVDLNDDIQLDTVNVESHDGTNERINTIRGSFPWEKIDHRKGYFVAQDQDAVTDDLGEEPANLRLPYCLSKHEARRIVERHLRQHANELRGSFSTGLLDHLELVPGSRINLKEDRIYNFSNQEARITKSVINCSPPVTLEYEFTGTGIDEFSFKISDIDEVDEVPEQPSSESPISSGGGPGPALFNPQRWEREDVALSAKNDTENKSVGSTFELQDDQKITIFELGIQDIDALTDPNLLVRAEDTTNNEVLRVTSDKFDSDTKVHNPAGAANIRFSLNNETNSDKIATGYVVYQIESD